MILLLYQLFFIVSSFLFCKATRSGHVRNPDHRIVGGKDVSITKAPFIASLQIRRGSYTKHVCGAVIVTKTYLLTAGHCLYDHDKLKKKSKAPSTKKYIVSTGSSYAERGLATKVHKIFIHPDFDHKTLINDFGAIVVAKDLHFDLTTQPAILPEGEIKETSYLLERYSEGRTKCQAYGWGVTVARSYTALKVVDLHLVGKSACQKILSERKMGTLDEKNQFCTLEEKEEKDACQGDSGGPLSCNGVIWGLVSWGEGCARLGNPAIFARTDVAKKWLEDVVYKTDLDSRSSAPYNFFISDQTNIILLVSLGFIL